MEKMISASKNPIIQLIAKAGLVIAALLFGLYGQAQAFDLVVALDGSGTHSSITRALQSRSEFKRIFVKNGVYHEKLNIKKSGISIIGEDPDSVFIKWGDFSGDGTHSTGTSYTILLDANDIYLENLTIENTHGRGAQAVALHTKGDRIAINNCNLIGFQDTYYVDGSGMVYTTNSFIAGATDYIFGDATTVLENCEIHGLVGGSHTTAPADPKLTSKVGDKTILHGLLFIDCNLTHERNVPKNSYDLARPWQDYSSSVYVNCTMDEHIQADGWSTWGGEKHLNGFFAEFESKNPDGTLLDVSGRTEWSTQLTADEVANYYNRDYYLTKSGNTWRPVPITTPLAAPSNLTTSFADSEPDILNWAEVTGAVGYVILSNGLAVGFSESASFTDTEADLTQERKYTVKSVSTSGALSGASNEVTAPGRDILSTEQLNPVKIRNSGGNFELSEKADVTVFTISGQKLFEGTDLQHFTLQSDVTGVVVLRLLTDKKLMIRKVML